MKSNYKRLGEYIQEVNERDTDNNVSTLLGVSIQKVFMPSIANTIGTDMSTYKIVRRNQFAYGPVTSRNGDKISVALLEDYDEAIVSQAYTVFRILDEEELLPEYLMMWMRRPEFDRYARFMSHGSAREIFGWDEMCNVMLPMPHPDKQREIVREYKIITNRIALNRQLNQKLEETAQAIYKKWFVDFEFPDTEGKPYKTNGGEMEYCKELEKEIPKGWEVVSIGNYCADMKTGGTPSRDENTFWNSNDIPWLKTGEVSNNIIVVAEEYISKKGFKSSNAKLFPVNTVLMAMYGVTAGQLGFLKFESTTNQACCGMICNGINEAAYLYYYLLFNQQYISGLSNGGAQPNLSKGLIEELQIIRPDKNLFEYNIFSTLINCRENVTRESMLLEKLSSLLLSKLSSLN